MCFNMIAYNNLRIGIEKFLPKNSIHLPLKKFFLPPKKIFYRKIIRPHCSQKTGPFALLSASSCSPDTFKKHPVQREFSTFATIGNGVFDAFSLSYAAKNAAPTCSRACKTHSRAALKPYCRIGNQSVSAYRPSSFRMANCAIAYRLSARLRLPRK